MATLTAVLDSAVDTTHPELQGRITANVSQVGTLRSGVTHVYDHGTAAAGIIGATGNNGQGLTGIGQQQRLLLEEVITSEGAATSDVTAALFTGHYIRSGDAADALARTASSVFDLLSTTYEAGAGELLLVEAQDAYAQPRLQFEVEAL